MKKVPVMRRKLADFIISDEIKGMWPKSSWELMKTSRQKKERKILSTHSKGKEAKEKGRKKTNRGLGNGHCFSFWSGRLYIFIWQGKVSNCAPPLLLDIHVTDCHHFPIIQQSNRASSSVSFMLLTSHQNRKLFHHLCLIMENLVYRIFMITMNWYQYPKVLKALRGNTHN